MQEKERIYKNLQREFTAYKQIKAVPINETNEEMVSLSQAGFPISPYNKTLDLSTGDDLFVRRGLLEKLWLAQEFVKAALDDDYELQVTYAYRQPSIQERKFIKIIAREIQNNPEASNEEWINNTHRYIACPDVAGHPTGGAVDVWIIKSDGTLLDMGTPTHTLSEDSYVFSPFISDEAQQNRALLRNAMQRAGFAPFDGEWWHFSYGDREWAVVAGQAYALYGQIDFDYRAKASKSYRAPTNEELINKAKAALSL